MYRLVDENNHHTDYVFDSLCGAFNALSSHPNGWTVTSVYFLDYYKNIDEFLF